MADHKGLIDKGFYCCEGLGFLVSALGTSAENLLHLISPKTNFHSHVPPVVCVSAIRVRSLCLNRWKNTPQLSSFLYEKNKTKKKDSMTDDCLDCKFISFGFVHMLLQGNDIFLRRDLDRFRPRCE